MPKKRWTARHGKHEIALCSHWTLVRGLNGEWMEVDGKRVFFGRAGAFDTTSRLSGSVELSGEQVELEGLAGWDGIKLRGQIRVDGALIGGDASMGGLERLALEKLVKGGFLRFVIIHGLLLYGLSFGVVMAIVDYLSNGADLARLAGVAAISGGIYGLGMGATFYAIHRRALNQLYPYRSPGV